MSSNQRRFSGATAHEAVAAARAAVGPNLRIVAAERVTKPGLFGRRQHVVVTVEVPPQERPEDFARALSAALAQPTDEATAPSEVEALASVYASARLEAPSVVVAPIGTPSTKVVGRGGEVRRSAKIAPASWTSSTSSVGATATAMIDDRAERLVVDLAARPEDVVVDVARGEAERAQPPAASRVIAVVVPRVPYPLAALDTIADRLGIPDTARFVLARRRREVPQGLRSSADQVARALARSTTRVAVLVDADQLRLLRESFLASMLWVVVAVDGTEQQERLEDDLSALGPIDALYCVTSESAAVRLGLAVVG